MADGMTPMMRQYVELKEKYADCLLFFRLGDFYEMFFEDAKTVSSELDLVLTGKDCGLSERAPMCGVPYHSVDFYITKLIQKGYKVAICEQLEDPAQAKGLVQRDVIRVITPGTVIEENMLPSESNNYIAAVCVSNKKIGLSYADVSTGAFFCSQIEGKKQEDILKDELARIRPTEVIIDDAIVSSPVYKWISSCLYAESFDQRFFREDNASTCLKNHFGVQSLSGYGIENLPGAVCASGALMRYLEDTQKNALSHIGRIKLVRHTNYMLLDASTRRNLELTTPLRTDGSKKNTLMYLLNKTQTAMGARLLHSWIDCPLICKESIEERQQGVTGFFNDTVATENIVELLKSIYDIERLSSRIVYGSVNPKDCKALERSLNAIPFIKAHLSASFDAPIISSICEKLDPMEDIADILFRMIVEDPPVGIKDGGFIKNGYDAEIDELRDIKSNAKQWLADYENKEKQETGIKNLKIGYNRVFGYYIEVTKSYYALIPERYERKQTLSNAERFFTPELKEMENRILGADERLILLEQQLFSGIRDLLLRNIERLQNISEQIATLDCLQSLANVAKDNKYVCPLITNERTVNIKSGRHPIVERNRRNDFVPNDVLLDNGDNRMLIITGPNMAGKSTYMRQVAIITLMAHIGSYVPADSAEIGIVDQIFTRIGASDDLASGQSTFMVEMSEMANILNNATEKSLLILDEIGRGTSTFDGLSIAWSVLEHIADEKICGAKTLFATHYHELTELEGKIQGVKNYRITVKEMGDDIIFLRRIVRGSGDKSFGIQVAKLAGLPADVLKRAKAILKDLVHADITAKTAGKAGKSTEQHNAFQGSIFDVDDESTLIRLLQDMDPDTMSPREALDELYKLKMIASGKAAQ